mmetsp:Transcript_22116/g.54721  ORF Transcript_22116/g.54721 Transcript_22116/m.54721 type:complete len:229 (-) Transcript_22116:908-1594(-)
MGWAATHKVRRWHSILVTRILELTVAKVKVENCNRVGVLVGHQQVLPGIVELKVSGGFSAGVDASNLLEFSPFGSLGLDTKDGNGLVSSIGDNHKASRFVHAHAATGVHGSGKSIGDSADGLNQSKCRATFESVHVLSVFGGGMNFVQEFTIDLKDGNGRTEFVDDVGNVVLRMKFKVARAIRFARAEARGHDIELNGNVSIVGIVIKLSNQIFSEIGNVGNLPHKGI